MIERTTTNWHLTQKSDPNGYKLIQADWAASKRKCKAKKTASVKSKNQTADANARVAATVLLSPTRVDRIQDDDANARSDARSLFLKTVEWGSKDCSNNRRSIRFMSPLVACIWSGIYRRLPIKLICPWKIVLRQRGTIGLMLML